jgi:UDP-N-acetylglucosamine--N-acetylmuramyl-(pentapeptide) pyrophosphoryl-undecaprenol N-acetylglucosamine transferase
MAIITLLAVAAGSGGHILPAVTLASEWKQAEQGRHVIFITGATPLEHKIMDQSDVVDKALHISLAKISRRAWFRLPLVLLQLGWLFVKSIITLLEYKPQRVVTTGGIHAIPVCLAACLLRIPIDAYELNVQPGKAFMVLKYLATRLFCVFKETQPYLPTSTLVAYPIRAAIKQAVVQPEALINLVNSQNQHKAGWVNFELHRKTIFILGGSQGSLLLNKLIKGFLTEHVSMQQRIQVIHQTGSFEEGDWERFYRHQQIPAVTFSYDPLIAHYYQLADLIICRAGAGTLFEIAYLKRPCIVIPLLAQTTDHQLYNAQAMMAAYPAIFTVLTQQIVTADHEALFEKIKTILF